MTIKNILVYLKANEQWSPHIDYAFDISAQFGARIVGVTIFDDIAIMRRHYGRRDSRVVHEQVVQNAINQQHAHNREVVAVLEKKFAATAEEKQLAHDFVVIEGRSREMLPWAARFHDLTILEQPDPAKDEGGHEAAEETALSAGRPLIVAPQSNKLMPVPEVLLLAWNGSTEAAAALQGALSFLKAAKSITVLVGEQRKRSSATASAPQFDITTSLKQHVKKVAAEYVSVSDDEIGAYILERAQAIGAQLIIMGAYGRSRLSELILGGATRHIFRHASVPVLMGH